MSTQAITFVSFHQDPGEPNFMRTVPNSLRKYQCLECVSNQFQKRKSKMADQAGRPADWEMAKENIQPLKQGRKMAKLANCLQVRFQWSTVADPHHFNPDPYPSFHFNADPDPMFNFHPGSPDPDPHKSDGTTYAATVLQTPSASIVSIPCLSLSSDSDPTFHFNADPDPIFNFRPDPPILILVKVMKICGHWSTNPSTAPF
jgi:hypothetical protein